MLSPQYQHCAPEILQNAEFQELKKYRNNVGTVCNDKWQKAIHIQDPTRFLKRRVNFEVINRACFKLIELIPEVKVAQVRRCACICEAPGGFMQTLRLLYPSADLKGFSLRGPSCIKFSPIFSEDMIPIIPNNGNIYRNDTRDAIADVIGLGTADLVTGDGGISQDDDLDNAEQNSLKLLIAQLLIILRVQSEHGTCILKIFEGSTLATIDIYRCMKLVYKSVKLCKPSSSRATNSERYVVANGYNKELGDQLYLELNKICNFVENTKSYLYCAFSTPPSEETMSEFKNEAIKQANALEYTFENIANNNGHNFNKMRSSTFEQLLQSFPPNLLS